MLLWPEENEGGGRTQSAERSQPVPSGCAGAPHTQPANWKLRVPQAEVAHRFAGSPDRERWQGLLLLLPPCNAEAADSSSPASGFGSFPACACPSNEESR